MDRRRLQQQADRRPLLRRRLDGLGAGGRPATTSSRRGTATATARTPPRPRPATTTSRPASTGSRFGKISGVAPAAKIAAYKVLWRDAGSTQAGGYTSDIVAAIDAAVARRRRRDQLLDRRHRRTRRTTTRSSWPSCRPPSAGIFVAASAGNSGPAASTLDNTSPWVTTVAAHTIAAVRGHRRARRRPEVRRRQHHGPATRSARPAWSPPPPSRPRAATPADAALCAPDTLDPAMATGKIIVCDRGVYDRVAKSAEVKRAGGLGHGAGQPHRGLARRRPALGADRPPRPARRSGREGVRRDGRRDRVLRPGQPDRQPATPYPQIAGFSSRGPSTASRRRPGQARSGRAGRRHPGRRRAAQQRGSRLRLLLRHLDGRPARRRAGRALSWPSTRSGRRCGSSRR